MIKHSRQRDLIRSFLDGRKDHPTAEAVYLGIRQELPTISLATVYRNLSLLADMGEINRITTPDRIDHFDYNTEPHEHLLCERCRGITDIDITDIGNIDEMAQEKYGGKVKGHVLLFYGTCKECLKAE